MILLLGKVAAPPHSSWFYDFLECYYPAGRLIIENPFNLYDPSKNFVSGFVNIPIFALVFTPFATLARRPAVILFSVLGILFVLASCYFLIRLTKVWGWRQTALIGLFAINGPLYNSLWVGNLTHFVLLLLIAAVFCLEKQRQVWLGIILATAALIKLPILLLGIYFAVRRKWRVVVGFGAALLALTGASLLLFGLDLHLTWLHYIQQISGQPISGYSVQSVDGFLSRLLLDPDGALESWAPIAVGWKYKLIRYALISLLVGPTIWICWRSKSPTTLVEENLEFSIVLCLALVISPISWAHYYLFLLLPFALYLGNRIGVPEGWLWSSLVGTSILLTSLPVIVLSPTNSVLRFLYSKWLISNYFFGGVLLLGVLLAARWYTAKRSSLSLPRNRLMEQG